MKKFFYVAAAFLAAGFVSCSENDGSELQAPASDLAPIRFDLGSARVDVKQQAPATRGKGAIGDVDATKNQWNGEELKVYMFDQGTLDLTLDETGDGTTALFNNESITATAGATEVVVATQKYYPMQGNHDFFAYHADDAVAGDVVVTEETYTLPVTIDGSQDLMVAKAALKDGQEELLGARATDYYSAYSARKGVNPHFTFQHLLTRFTFEVKAAADVDVNNVKINAVEVADANTTANMVVAYKTAPAELLADQANPATVSLKGIDAAGVTPSKDNFEKVGESLLLMPQASYEMNFTINQTIDGVARDISYPVTLVAADLGLANGAFEAGKQYNVKLTIYGLSEIKLELELTPWVDGGDIEVDDDADVPVLWVDPNPTPNN